MSAVLAEFVPVASLTAGDQIRYCGGVYCVAEVLPIAVMSGFVVAAFPVGAGHDDYSRVALIYANDQASAQLAGA